MNENLYMFIVTYRSEEDPSKYEKKNFIAQAGDNIGFIYDRIAESVHWNNIYEVQITPCFKIPKDSNF